MRLKRGVTLQGVQWPIKKAIAHADRIWRQLGRTLVVTSTTHGSDPNCALHTFGFAVDFRSFYFGKLNKEQAARLLQKALGNDYKVMVMPTHIHCEYDEASTLSRRQFSAPKT